MVSIQLTLLSAKICTLAQLYIYTEATTMAGSSCEDISISGGHDPCNCTWSDEVASDIRRCLYTVSIQLILLSAKIMYMYTTKEKERFFKVCYFSKKSETCVTCTVIIIINRYTLI